jgi:hypothetical protein
MHPFYAILQAIQPLPQQIKSHMKRKTMDIPILALFHKVSLQAFKFPLPNFCLWMGRYKLEVE